MGCAASKLDCEESVTRCKNRKHFIKLAVAHRHAFAAAHASYTQSLKNTGAAIRQFGEGEAKDHPDSTPAPANARNSQPLPPPKPTFLNLPRALSLPPPMLRGVSPARSPSLTPSRLVAEGEGEKESFLADAKPPPRLPAEPETDPPPPPLSNDQSWGIFNVFQSDRSPFNNANTESEGEYTPLKIKEAAKENGGLDLNSESRKREEEHAFTDDDSVNEKARLQERDETAEPSVEEEDGDDPSESRHRTKTGTGKRLSDVLRGLDDQFLMAFESGKEVARMLEARKMHYHSNFANPEGTRDHHSKVLRVMSWGGNTKTSLLNLDKIDDVHSEEKETHASTLDKLLAWEKKLHDEVKAGEVIRIELERKSVQLKNQKRREEDSAAINKTKAVVKSLQTRYLVEFEAVDAAFLEIQKLRDDLLHSQLVNLVKELMTMWKIMFDCHQQQYQLIADMESLDSSFAPVETNELHTRNTLQLYNEIKLWHDNFDKLITSQKEYMNALYHWLRLNIIQIESEVKDKVASPPKMITSPVYNLCRAWLDGLDQLPGNVALHALTAFSNIIHEVNLQQDEELKQKKKLESLQKELDRKEQFLKDQETKYNGKYMDLHVSDEKEDLTQEGVPDRNPFKEKEVILDSLRRRVHEEKENYEKLCLKSGSMTLTSLQKGLPPILQTIRDFAHTCSEHYKKLYKLATEEDIPKLQLSY